MSSNPCRQPEPRPPAKPRRKICHPPVTGCPQDNDSLLMRDLRAAAVVAQIQQSGFAMDEIVRPYTVTTVRIRQQQYLQQGSAPNFQGGLITLCTCKHQMRGNYSAQQWEDGVWITGLSSMSEAAGEQNLYYLMRVYLAYASHADLVAGLRASGHQAALDAKDARQHDLGDVIMPRTPDLHGEARFTPASYHPPRVGHVHRPAEDPDYWHADIDYSGRVCRPSLLVGDPALSFIWTRPLVQLRHPHAIRDYENWTLSHLLAQLQDIGG